MASEFLLEIGTEEIPARMAPPAAAQLRTLFLEEAAALAVAPGDVQTFCTPRRIVLVARGIETRQADRVEEKLGPAVKACFDDQGQPTKAAIGFAKGQGIEPSALERVQTPKGEYVCVHRRIEGRPVAELLEPVLPRIFGRLHFPKSMRWGTETTPFVRPIHWIVALFDGQVVPFGYAGVAAGASSRGHRFLAPASFDVLGVDDYLAKVAAAHVVVDRTERRRRIEADLARLGDDAGGTVIPDTTGLIEEVADLVEEPHTTLGRFDEAYLRIPKEVLVSAMRGHQRYFAYVAPDGALRNAFAVVSNTRAEDQAVVTRGNERVLRARLDDARFFFEDDCRRPLPDYLPALEERVFLKPLGTVRAKTERVVALAGALAELLAPAAKETAQRAALLAKADLCTHVVGEFPDLQGVMGREYARLSGEPAAVAEAIFEHYLPRGAGDVLPASDAGAIVSLADKADSIAGCFGIGLTPTATQDPYALRRQALGIIHVLASRGWRVPLEALFRPAVEGYAAILKRPADVLLEDILQFIEARLRHLLTAEFASDLVEAVLAADGRAVVDARAKVKALAGLRADPDFEALAVAFKRVVNIVKAEPERTLRPAELVDEAERALHAAHEALRGDVTTLVAAHEFDAALRKVTSLKPAVDHFFDKVMVMVDDEAVRSNRVALLQSIAGTFRQIADFSRIQVERS